MTDKPDLPARIGMAINELDIDFSRLSLAGWFTSAISLGIGGAIAYLVARWMVNRNGLDLAAGLVFCFTLIAITTLVFLGVRWLLAAMGLAVTKPRQPPFRDDSSNLMP